MYRLKSYVLTISLLAVFLSQIFQTSAIWTHSNIRAPLSDSFKHQNPLSALSNLNPLTPFQSVLIKRQIDGNDITPEGNSHDPGDNPLNNLFPGFKSIGDPDETEAEKAERIHKTFEKLLTFVEIVGQVDNYVSSKWKNLVKTVSNLYDEDEDDRGDADYRLGSRNKKKGCGGR